jgi:hypothetical protein
LLESVKAQSALDLSAITVADFCSSCCQVQQGPIANQLKYDSWQKELQNSFASILGQCCINEGHQNMSDGKTTLSLESSSNMENIDLGVTFIQEKKSQSEAWTDEMERLDASERLFKRQRGNWMETKCRQGPRIRSIAADSAAPQSIIWL